MDIVKRRTRVPELVMWRDFDEFPNRLRQFLTGGLAPEALAEPMAFMPSIEMVELEGELVLTAELPGMKADDVEILFEEGVLTLKGEKKAEIEEKNPRFHMWERAYGEFTRSFNVPRTVDVAKVTAQFVDGILTVRLPKTTESVGRKIEIEAR